MMSSPKSRFESEFMTLAKTGNIREVRQSPTDGKDVARDSEKYQEREDLEKALRESKKSEAPRGARRPVSTPFPSSRGLVRYCPIACAT
jgi:hypothetical protein